MANRFVLLTLVYYLSGGMYLIKDGSSLLPYQASLIGLMSLVIGWLIYDLLWNLRWQMMNHFVR